VIKSALDLVDVSIDFSHFNIIGNDQLIDAITIVHSGYAAEHDTSQRNRIWSHKWKFRDGPWISAEGIQVLHYNINPALWGTWGNQIGRIGVICHELGHYLGIYDLYDTQAYAGSTLNGYGIGLHGLMANSWGFDFSQLFPAHLSPWTMLQLGFASSTTPYGGVNTVLRMDLTPTGDQKSVYKIGDGTLGFPIGEYLLVSYAKFMKYDVSSFQGILIYHIDENVGYNDEGYPGQYGWPDNGKHYRIALLQADGKYDLERGADFGDSGDFFKLDWSITPDGVYYKGTRVNSDPSTNTYQAGVIQNTGLTIQVVSSPEGDTMDFLIFGRDDLPSIPAPTVLTGSPTQSPTLLSTSGPTPNPTSNPTLSTPLGPTETPTPFSTPSPTQALMPSPISVLTLNPTLTQSDTPTKIPLPVPTTHEPTQFPTQSPIVNPTSPPSGISQIRYPTTVPSVSPSPKPTSSTVNPTSSPTQPPTTSPTMNPTQPPTTSPTPNPTHPPTVSPTPNPTQHPTVSPTPNPTRSPTVSPTSTPTVSPTFTPTPSPTVSPTPYPTPPPTVSPTPYPTPSPSVSPTNYPTTSPTVNPTTYPTLPPAVSPTANPTVTLNPRPTKVTTTVETPSPANPPTTPNPSSDILIIASEDFEDPNFEFATASQLSSMTGIEQERYFDGGKLGTLIQPNSLVVCGARCKLVNSQGICIGNKCVNLAGNTELNASLMIGVDTMGRHHIEIDFLVYTRSPVTIGDTVCVDFAANTGMEWEQLQCYDIRDITRKKWTILQATTAVPDNIPIVQFRIRSLQRRKSLFVDSIQVFAMSQEGPKEIPGRTDGVPGTESGQFFSQIQEQVLTSGYIPKYPKLKNHG
jgi:M6 family metalloprotease-like protein